MNRREREALDRHITGNYGEDQFRGMEESMNREEALDALSELLESAKALPFGDPHISQKNLEEIIAVLSSPCALTKMGIARRLTAIKASIESCKAADDFYEMHRSNALQGISDFFDALEQEGKPE